MGYAGDLVLPAMEIRCYRARLIRLNELERCDGMETNMGKIR
jgi:hypothetical protein